MEDQPVISAVPKTMKAWVYKSYGENPEQLLSIEENYEVPKPQKGEVLVKVNCCSVNPIDW